jgi:hypothetical protein
LPAFVTYEESALNNINEALDQVFANCAADSSAVHKDLKARFQRYFTNLGNRRFLIRYQEKKGMDSITAGNPSVSLGMRYSVYCSGQIAFADKSVIAAQEKRFPWLAGYVFNNVNHPICDCWKVRPVPRAIRLPVRSAVPALISAGDADPWCRPSYNRLIKRGMPNAQLLILHDKGHGAGYSAGGVNYSDVFMNAPMQPIKASGSGVVIE